MKLKQQPDDFQVEEITSVRPTDGPFALYRLEKRGWSTPDALAALRRRWRIEAGRIAYGGLKDRHAWTVQYLTIFHGPRRGLRHHDVTVQYLGQVSAAYTSQDIQANRFRLTLRDLSSQRRTPMEARLSALRARGCRIISTISVSAPSPAGSSSRAFSCKDVSRTPCVWP